MDEKAPEGLAGKRLLVVEDDYMIAVDLARGLEAAGAEVVGPASTVQDALTLVGSERLDGAVRDINLGGDRAYPVADALTARQVPFVFATGYDEVNIPVQYADKPRCEKPVDTGRLMRLLASVSTSARS
jgi:ActR/RegA family two-component response regulator